MDQEHTASLLIACIDYRFWEITVQKIKEKYHIKNLDLATLAGEAKLIAEENPEALKIIFSEIDIAKNVHHADKIFLVNHQDCGAYGGSISFENLKTEFNKYKEDLLKAKNIISQNFPQLKITTLQLKFTDKNISLEEIL